MSKAGVKTGHCPWSGKEGERNTPQVRDYLSGLGPTFSHPTRGTSGWVDPRTRSRRAVQARLEEK
jgi:hypothetical protein